MNIQDISAKVLDFLKKMLSNSDEVSSKRVVGFLSFLLLALAWTVALFKGPLVPEFYWYGIVGLVVACFGLNAYLSGKYLSAPTPETKKDEEVVK